MENLAIERHLNALKVGLDRVHFIQSGMVDECGRLYHFLKSSSKATDEERADHLKRVGLALEGIKQTESFITLLQLELEQWHLQQKNKQD